MVLLTYLLSPPDPPSNHEKSMALQMVVVVKQQHLTLDSFFAGACSVFKPFGPVKGVYRGSLRVYRV